MTNKAPIASYETTIRWMKKAGENARNQGKHDSAALWEDATGHLDILTRQAERYRKALEFYADEGNNNRIEPRTHGLFTDRVSKVMDDCGQIARTALDEGERNA